MNGHVLALPNINKPFVVQTNASDYALRGMLLQEGYPVAFESHKLFQVESHDISQEKELLIVIHCLWI